MKNFEKAKGFTLAETMIVLVVLGVIAVVTVPALVNKHIESANRTKVKKAMSVYDTALNKMVIENGIKDNAALYENANSFAPENDCTNTAPYFKVSTVLNNNICTFKAPDGLFWDISKINAPIIAFSEADLNNANAENRYQLVGHFDNNGSLRVDDLAFETGENKTVLTKVYNYINNVKEEECATKECKIEKYKNTVCSTSIDYDACPQDECVSCIHDFGSGYGIYDENGKKMIAYYGCGYNYNIPVSECTNVVNYSYDSAGHMTEEKDCNIDGVSNCSTNIYEYDSAGHLTIERYSCNGDGIRCQYCYVGYYGGGGKCVKNSHGYYDPEDTVYPEGGLYNYGSDSRLGYYSSNYYSGSGSGSGW